MEEFKLNFFKKVKIDWTMQEKCQIIQNYSIHKNISDLIWPFFES